MMLQSLSSNWMQNHWILIYSDKYFGWYLSSTLIDGIKSLVLQNISLKLRCLIKAIQILKLVWIEWIFNIKTWENSNWSKKFFNLQFRCTMILFKLWGKRVNLLTIYMMSQKMFKNGIQDLILLLKVLRIFRWWK